MGVLRSYLEKIVQSGLTKALAHELDLIRSEYPQVTAGAGFLKATASAMSYLSLSLQVPSNHFFHLKNMIIANQQEAVNIFVYDGPGYSAPKFDLIIGASQGVILGPNDLVGQIFNSIPMVSFSGSACSIKIGGLIRERLYE